MGLSAGRYEGSSLAEILSVPFIFAYSIVLGLRLAFEVPVDLPANWIFRLAAAKNSSECIPLARKIMLTFVIPWVVAFAMPVYAYLWGWAIAGIHAVSLCFLLFLSKSCWWVPQSPIHLFISTVPRFCGCDSVLVRPRLFRFRRIHLNLEYRALLHPLYVPPLILIGPAVWYVASLFGETIANVDKQLIFDEYPGAFRVARLRAAVIGPTGR